MIRTCRSTSSWMACRTMLLLQCLLFSSLNAVVNGGIIPYDLLLLPQSDSVQFDNGIVRSPGYIDLSGLTFSTTINQFGRWKSGGRMALSKFGATNGDDIIHVRSNNNNNAMVGSNSMKLSQEDLDELRIEAEILAHASSEHQLELASESDSPNSTTYIDIAIFRIPAICANTGGGCDWSQLGVGKRQKQQPKKSTNDNNSGIVWCCSNDAIQNGLCTINEMGRLLIDKKRYRGDIHTIQIPDNDRGMVASTEYHLKNGKTIITTSGTYVLLYSNCNTEYGGRSIHVTGQTTWKSKHGYLPGELYNFMIFYCIVSLIYICLFAAFGLLMSVYKDSRIDIEKWIIISIGMGLLEMIFRSGDYIVWNIMGTRSTMLVWIGIFVGSFKQGISRCLLVMVSMGWGVTRDTLGSMINPIILFGGAYICTEAIINSMVYFTLNNNDTISLIIQDGVVGTIALLSTIKIIIDIIFVGCVLESLRTTILLLTRLNQQGKLARTRHLRNIMLCCVLFNACSTIFFRQIVEEEEGGIIQTKSAWANTALNEMNYLFVLIGIAILWRPNYNARQYVYTMELPSTNDSLLDRSNRSCKDEMDCSGRGGYYEDSMKFLDRSSRGFKDVGKGTD